MMKMEHFDFSSELMLMHQNFNPYFFLHNNFLGPQQGSQSGPKFGKADTGVWCRSRATEGLATKATLEDMNCQNIC
jgi:hypothetical protein